MSDFSTRKGHPETSSVPRLWQSPALVAVFYLGAVSPGPAPGRCAPGRGARRRCPRSRISASSTAGAAPPRRTPHGGTCGRVPPCRDGSCGSGRNRCCGERGCEEKHGTGKGGSELPTALAPRRPREYKRGWREEKELPSLV